MLHILIHPGRSNRCNRYTNCVVPTDPSATGNRPNGPRSLIFGYYSMINPIFGK